MWVGVQSRRNKQSVIIIFLCLTLTTFLIPCEPIMAINTLSLDSSETGPSISWPPEPNILFMDGAYTGQTQEIFEWGAWVNDSLGVDSVLLRFKWSYEEEWVNRTTVLVDGDEFLGKYIGNRTWPAPGGGTFQLKIFANNTLGYWNETLPMTVHFGYLYFDPIYRWDFWVVFVILPIVSLIGLVGVWKLRQKRRST